MAHLVAGLGHAGADHPLVVLGAGVQPPRQFAARRRQDENADQIGGRVFAQLLGALPIDVEQHVAALLERLLYRLSRRAIEVAEYLGILQELTILPQLVEAIAVDEMVMPSVDSTR